MAGDYDFLIEEVRGRLMSWLIVATGLEKLVYLFTVEISCTKTNKKALLFRSAYTTLEFRFVSRRSDSEGKTKEEAEDKIDEYTNGTGKKEDDKNEEKQSILLKHEDGPF